MKMDCISLSTNNLLFYTTTTTPINRYTNTPNTNTHKHGRRPCCLSTTTNSISGFNYCQLNPKHFYKTLTLTHFPHNFTSYSSAHDARTSQSSAELRQSLSLKSLFGVYKEAIVYRDLETIAEVEAVLSGFENEKNELLQKVSDMSTEISSGKNRYVRLQADFENFRKRSEKERLTIRSDAQGELLEALLPMVDSFERAKQIIKPETEREIKIDTSYQGIYKQFVEIMRSLRIAAVPTVGKPFDPSMHEAIAREESQEFKEGIVIQELRRGFLLGSRLLRPAMVKVSSGPGKIKVTEKSPTTAAGLDER